MLRASSRSVVPQRSAQSRSSRMQRRKATRSVSVRQESAQARQAISHAAHASMHSASDRVSTCGLPELAVESASSRDSIPWTPFHSHTSKGRALPSAGGNSLQSATFSAGGLETKRNQAETIRPRARCDALPAAYSLRPGSGFMSEPEGEQGAKSPVVGGEHIVVGLGASAGGLEALEEFFDELPANPGMSF